MQSPLNAGYNASSSKITKCENLLGRNFKIEPLFPHNQHNIFVRLYKVQFKITFVHECVIFAGVEAFIASDDNYLNRFDQNLAFFPTTFY